MCTTVAKLMDNSWYLAKTRDPVKSMRWDDEIHLFETKIDKYKKWIVQNPDPKQDGYYGGINDHGVAFVATFVRVVEDQISYIRKPYVRLILEAGTAKEAVEIIKAFNPKIGGNMLVADEKEGFGIEGAPDKYFVEKITKSAVKTNHLLNFPYRNLDFKTSPNFEAWSKTHQLRAEELISNANSVADLEALLKDRKNAENQRAICTTEEEDACFTHSAFIFDTKNKVAYYAQGNPLTTPFKKYKF